MLTNNLAQRRIELRPVEAQTVRKAQKIIKSRAFRVATTFSRQTQMTG